MIADFTAMQFTCFLNLCLVEVPNVPHSGHCQLHASLACFHVCALASRLQPSACRKETLACLCSCTPCEGIHAQVTSRGGGGGARVYNSGLHIKSVNSTTQQTRCRLHHRLAQHLQALAGRQAVQCWSWVTMCNISGGELHQCLCRSRCVTLVILPGLL